MGYIEIKDKKLNLITLSKINGMFRELFNRPVGSGGGGGDTSGLVPKTTTVNGHSLSSSIVIMKSDVGLGNCHNTSDLDKPVSTAMQTALNAKQNITTPKLLFIFSNGSQDNIDCVGGVLPFYFSNGAQDNIALI